MIKLSYIIDDTFLASYIVANSRHGRFIEYARSLYQEDLVAFQNLAWNLSKDLFEVIDGRYPLIIYKSVTGDTYQSIGIELDKYISKLILSPQFLKLKEQTHDSKKVIEAEWNSNYEKTFNYIKSLGINLEGSYEIVLTHPGLKAGRYMGNNRINWSYQTYWPNYNTVYLWHEILHSFFGDTKAEHALIELITDDEMRIQLNGGKYPPCIGHDYLEKIKEQIVPQWMDYLRTNNKEIHELISRIKLCV